MTDAGRRADLAYAAVDRLLAKRPRGAGIFVSGHSMGCVLALRMAAGDRGAGLLGLAISGIGREQQPGVTAMLGTRARRGRGIGGAAFRELIWGPAWLYPARGAAGISAPAPGYKTDEMQDWPRDFPALAARVRVPVHYRLGLSAMAYHLKILAFAEECVLARAHGGAGAPAPASMAGG